MSKVRNGRGGPGFSKCQGGSDFPVVGGGQGGVLPEKSRGGGGRKIFALIFRPYFAMLLCYKKNARFAGDSRQKFF